MINKVIHSGLVVLSLTLSTTLVAQTSSQPSQDKTVSAVKPSVNEAKSKDKVVYKSVQWVDLLPERELKALLEDPIENTISEGSAQDKITSNISMHIEDPVTEFDKALISVNVRGELNNTKIKLPGYIVPVDLAENGMIKSFFLVPFFGACLHLPPPPPNQIIFATSKEGVKIDNIEEAFWIEATLYTKKEENEMAVAAYSAVVDKHYLFKEGDNY